jgi:hypothetical protein
VTVLDTIPPEVACEIGRENNPKEGDFTPASNDSMAAPLGNKFKILYSGSDNCGEVTFDAFIVIACDTIRNIQNGQDVKINCNSAPNSTCKFRWKHQGNHNELWIKAVGGEAKFFVTATDAAGNVSETCMLDLCIMSIDNGDDDGEDAAKPALTVWQGGSQRDLNQTIVFELGLQRAHVSLAVYDVAGRLVDRIEVGNRTRGRHTVNWNATSQPSGVYFYHMDAGVLSTTRKVVLIR